MYFHHLYLFAFLLALKFWFDPTIIQYLFLDYLRIMVDLYGDSCLFHHKIHY